MVISALNKIRPGWKENKEFFIYLRLAQGLPVVVQLQSGTGHTQTLRRSEAIDVFDTDLPQGQVLDLHVDVIVIKDGSDDSQPLPPMDFMLEEFEIYRPRPRPDQTTIGGMSPNDESKNKVDTIQLLTESVTLIRFYLVTNY
jgi:hypothetical protein